MASAKPQEKTLDELIRELESQVERLEGGNMTVDESIKAYMEGMSTAVKCKAMLDEMTQKVTIAREKARKAMEEAGAPAQEGRDPEEGQW